MILISRSKKEVIYMKILVACDYYVRPEMLDKVIELKKYGCEVEVFNNRKLATDEEVTDVMLKTEQEGPESVSAGEEFIKAVEDVDILMVHLTPVNKEVIDSAKKLKLVGVMRGGCDSVNVELLAKKNIPVVNAPWRSSYAVADFTVGMILSETKNIAKSHHKLMEGNWSKDYPNNKNYTDMRNRTIGIIGFGYIGQLVAKNLSGFGSKILVHDPFMDNDCIESMGYKPVTIEELLKSCDVVTLHLRCSEKTMNFIGEKELSMMRPDATLINTARAGLINQEALIDALKNHRILGAAIDVYEEEPLSADNPYRSLDNITLTPHLAGTSNDTFTNGLEIVTENVYRYLKGEELKCKVK